MDYKNNRIVSAMLALWLCLISAGSLAHDFWIEPLPVTNKTQLRDLKLAEGVNLKGSTLPYIDDWFRRFELIDAEGKRNVESILGSDPAARIRLRAPGVTWALYQSVDNKVELEPEKFESYLREEGMDYMLPVWRNSGLNQAPARELFQRCAKALIWQPGGDERLLTQPQGLPLEIIPLNNPYRMDTPPQLRVRIQFADKPMAGITVMALNGGNLSAVPRYQSDAQGEVSIPIGDPGFWLIKAVHMTPIENNDADWISYWASLTFTLKE